MAGRKKTTVVEPMVIGEAPVTEEVQIKEPEIKDSQIKITPIYHKVKRGETILSIANMYHINPNSLKHLENQIVMGKTIRIR